MILAVASVRDGRRSVWPQFAAVVPMLLALALATAPTAIAHNAPTFTGPAPSPWIVVPHAFELASVAMLVARTAFGSIAAAHADEPTHRPARCGVARGGCDLAARAENSTIIPEVGVGPEAHRFLTDRPVVPDQAATRISTAFDRKGDAFLAKV
ncbi:MAG: hypothetical protein AB7I19_18555 [Planctomycetota bacterium]